MRDNVNKSYYYDELVSITLINFMKPNKFPEAKFHHKYNSLDFMNYKVLMGHKKFIGKRLADIINSDDYL